jgi:uncharacterized membrane-anchored protein YhcB (DUF1043 family)
MTNLILIAIAALAVGLVVGLLIGRSNTGSRLERRRVEQKIDELKSEYSRYQAQVNEHFAESADLMHRFNDAYHDMNRHMSQGANRLSNDDEVLQEFEKTGTSARLEGKTSSDPEMPRDYAPKSTPEEKGMLAEDFGLDKNKNKKKKEETE